MLDPGETRRPMSQPTGASGNRALYALLSSDQITEIVLKRDEEERNG